MYPITTQKIIPYYVIDFSLNAIKILGFYIQISSF